jgi:hypothetical protein
LRWRFAFDSRYVYDEESSRGKRSKNITFD